MANTYGPRSVGDAKATIQAELDRIAKEFSQSVRKCRQAAAVLMAGSQRQYGEIEKFTVKPARFNL
jgi:hypothetical protein